MIKVMTAGQEMVMNDCRGSCHYSEMGILTQIQIMFSDYFIQYLVGLGRNQFSIQRNCQHDRNSKQPISIGEVRTHIILLSPPQIFPVSLECPSFCLFIIWLVFFVHMCAIFKLTTPEAL